MARVVDQLKRDPAKAETAEPAKASGPEYGNRSGMTSQGVFDCGHGMKKSSQLRRQLDSHGAPRGAVVPHDQTIDGEWRGWGGYDDKREFGAVGQMKRVVGDAPDVQVREPPGPSTPDDEHVGVLQVRRIGQRVGWITFKQDGPPPVTSVGK